MTDSYLTTDATTRLFDLLINHDALTTKREHDIYLSKTNTELAQTTADLVTWFTRWVPLEILQQAVEAHPTQHFDEVYRAEAAAMEFRGQIKN